MSNRQPTIRCIVEASWGLGDMVEATSLCAALYRLGFDVDLYLNSAPLGRALAPALVDAGALARVLVPGDPIDPRRYAFGVSSFGDRQAVRMLPSGLCFDITWRDVIRDGLTLANLEPARLLGYDGPAPRPFVGPAVAASAADEVWPRTVVVHAGCDPANASKRWSGWPEICARLAAVGRHVVVVGTAVDRSESGWEGAYDARFDLPIRRVAAILSRADAYFGNDSGVGHLAAAVGVPGLVLFGPSDPRKFAPHSAAMRSLVVAARPGEGRVPEARRLVPIDRLTVDEVWAAVEALLDAPERPAEPPLGARRPVPHGDPEARLPSRDAVRATRCDLDAVDELFRRLAAAAVLGLVARAGNAHHEAEWRRRVAAAAAEAHLVAAAVRRRFRTRVSHKRALVHLSLAWGAGSRAMAVARGVALALTPPWRGAGFDDVFQH